MVRGPEAERILTVPVRPPMGHTMFHLCVCVYVGEEEDRSNDQEESM